ncbi:hypothetical protein HOLleu_38754 [Holothuria leucospilota]|uniref:Uncharacterized protein n=1 Tax=Holothuria leucospilota TaxID=206669 RepID=A0A9Q0YES5_HOLLE|nr:hypothetical protein HOLleu_38754 [Holothuria leucospilota]
MPTTPVFDDILTADHHVIYVEFGFIDSLDLGGEPSISSHGSESAIIIPFLADSPDGDPKYALALGSVYQRDRGAVSKLNIAFPYIGIDEISVTDTGVVWRNGSDELRATFVKSNPCRPASKVSQHEFEVTIDEELDFSFAEPDLEYCKRHSLVDHQVCDTLENLPCGLKQAGPNVCQFYQPPWEKSCETSVVDVTVTGEFRNLLLLNDDPVNVVSSEGLYGEYEVGLKYPCME